MQSFDFTHKQLEEIHDTHFWKFGGEGNLYRIFNGKKRYVLKLFYEPYKDQYVWPKHIIKNKEKKITILGESKLPNHIHILGRATTEHEFIGYVMSEAHSYQDFCLNTFLPSQQIIFLRKLRNQLQRFHDLGLFYGDLKSDNVLSHISHYHLGCLCDLDNMQVKEFPIDIRSDYVDEFLYQYGEVDEKLDWYVFNLLTTETLYHLDKTTTIPYHETRKFMDYYRGNSKALKEMQKINEHYQGNLLIDDPAFYEEIKVPYSLK